MRSSSRPRPSATASLSWVPSQPAAQEQAAASVPPEPAKGPAWQPPDEGVLCVRRRSCALHTWPDLSRLDAPDPLRLEPDTWVGNGMAWRQSQAVLHLPAAPFEAFMVQGEAAAAAFQGVPALEAPSPAPSPTPAPVPAPEPLAAGWTRPPGLSSAAAAAVPAPRSDSDPGASGPTATAAEASVSGARKRPRPSPSPSPRVGAAPGLDWARSSASASERIRRLRGLASRVVLREAPEAWGELIPPGLSAVAFKTRFAQFHQMADLLSLEEMGRLMFVFVSRWHDRQAEPWSPMQWEALNGEALRRDAELAPRVQACFVATYLFARGSQAQDRPAGGELVMRELTAALSLQGEGGTSNEKASNFRRSMAFAVTRLGQKDGSDDTFRMQASLLRCFSGCASAERTARFHARVDRLAGPPSAPGPSHPISGASPVHPATTAR